MAHFREFPSPTAFMAAVEDVLLQDECLNNVAIGAVQRALRTESEEGWSSDSDEPDRQFFGAVLRDNGDVDVPVWRTAPHPLGLGGGSVEGVQGLVQALDQHGIKLQGANCPRWAADIIGREVAALDGRMTKVSMAQRLFRLDELAPPSVAPGRMIDANSSDTELICHWAHRFNIDCNLAAPNSDPPQIPSTIVNGSLRFWVINGEPVAMAGSTRQSPRGASISWVYTPDAHRGHGYASNLVAALSRHFLESGKEFCCLFTDQANPTSNKIYQALGYKPVTDFHRIQFHPAD